MGLRMLLPRSGCRETRVACASLIPNPIFTHLRESQTSRGILLLMIGLTRGKIRCYSHVKKVFIRF